MSPLTVVWKSLEVVVVTPLSVRAPSIHKPCSWKMTSHDDILT